MNKEMDMPCSRPEHEPGSAGRKKASLLPAFEPFSSSPGLPKTLKRTRDVFEGKSSLPTPVPTSSTHILSSSPQQNPKDTGIVKATERRPLGALPTVRVKGDGTATKLGRSSQACDYQLSSNRLISRVHVEVTYLPSLGQLNREKIQIVCIGWNGVTIHCQSKRFELKRGAVFTSDLRDAEIMLDFHESRVILEWPDKPRLGPVSSDEEETEASPTKKLKAMRRHSTPPSPSPIHSRKTRMLLPMSPCPTTTALLPSSPPIMPTTEPPLVDIFEDPAEPEQTKAEIKQEFSTKVKDENDEPSSGSPSRELNSSQDFSDNDEENDPIVHSFGPFGANLLPRFAAVHAGTSPLRSSPVKPARILHSEPLQPVEKQTHARSRFADVDIQGHVINQLAFSRLSSLPLSTILSNLPHEVQSISTSELKNIIHDTACVGEIAREGKDAAGKPLENEFYYVPDADTDVHRKQAVVNDLRRPGMRACRKQHKQYYWKKPK